MKYLSYEGLQYLYSKILTRLGLKVDVTGGDISETVIETLDTVEDKYPVPAAGESVKRFFGKVLTFLRNIRPLTENINIYVSTTGSDITGDGTSSKPFKTIKHAIGILPKDLGGYTVVINVADGTYLEVVNIIGFNNGEFRLYSSNPSLLSDNCKVDRISIRYNTCLIVVGGFSIMTTTADGVVAESCTSLNIQFIKITGNALSSGKSGMAFYRCIFSVWNCQVSYHNVALLAYGGYGVSSKWATCVGNNYGLYSTYGSKITTIGSQPTANSTTIRDDGGSYTYENGTQIAGIFTAGLSCTWGTISGGYVRHGNIVGAAMVTIQCAVNLSVSLSAGITYIIAGFPPCPGISVAVSVHDQVDFYFCQLNPDGNLVFQTNKTITAGNYFLFNCTYLTLT